MIRWKSLAARAARYINVCSRLVCGRKWITVDQTRQWRRRGIDWRGEAAAQAADPYYLGLDRRLIKTLAELPQAVRFLEVGCFFGYRLGQVQAAMPGRIVVGVDMAGEALRAAREASPGGPGLRLVQGDAGRLPFRTGAVDCVYTVACLTHIPENRVEAALDEILRVSRRHLLLIEVYDRTMRLSRRWRVWGWEGGYSHPYERMLARRPWIRRRVEGIYDSAGHPRYTLFLYQKGGPA